MSVVNKIVYYPYVMWSWSNHDFFSYIGPLLVDYLYNMRSSKNEIYVLCSNHVVMLNLVVVTYLKTSIRSWCRVFSFALFLVLSRQSPESWWCNVLVRRADSDQLICTIQCVTAGESTKMKVSTCCSIANSIRRGYGRYNHRP